MIYTVTFNPALDYVVAVDELTVGEINRSNKETVFYGGKGINVSTVLNTLGIESVALGFIAGFTGDKIEQGVKEQGIKTDFIHLEEGMSRINIKIRSKEETDINGQGPVISKKAFDELFYKLKELKAGDILVLAGSIPNTMPEDCYEQIMNQLQGKGIYFIVDATKDLLRNVLKYKPFLIKPNHQELGELFGCELKGDEEIIHYAKALQKEGARNVLVSMAGDGAILLDENGNSTKINAADGIVKNSVGAGDSMVAGFLAGYVKTKDYNKALRLGAAAGSATAFSDGLTSKKQIMEVDAECLKECGIVF